MGGFWAAREGGSLGLLLFLLASFGIFFSFGHLFGSVFEQGVLEACIFAMGGNGCKS
jgi:hypothetical protein